MKLERENLNRFGRNREIKRSFRREVEHVWGYRGSEQQEWGKEGEGRDLNLKDFFFLLQLFNSLCEFRGYILKRDHFRALNMFG